MSYEKATIISILSKIQNGELVLPAIQRDFVWEPERMYKLLDSIFRSYPFSTLLFWNTRQRIQYREFTKDWSKDYRFTFQIKEEGKKGTMVLDGQQRLQTLYLAIYGTYEQKVLYFNLLSKQVVDDVSQAYYHFEYLDADDVNQRNQVSGQYWVPLRDLANLDNKRLTAKAMHYLAKLGLSADSPDGHRLSENIGVAHGVLRGDDVMNYFTIDKDYGDDGVITDLEEILEIFVRVNSGGQVLSKSDLMFSLMQMMWEGAADAIADLIDRLNAVLDHYDFDKDFILKVALVCVGAGAKYEVKKLRNEATVAKIKQNFGQIENAMLNCMEFVRDTARLVDERILRSYNTLIPFIYFYYLQPDQVVRGEETLLRMNRTLYLALMTGVFSRYADTYIDHLVTNVLDESHANQPGRFPMEACADFIQTKQGRGGFDDGLLQANVQLLMNILEGGTRLPEGKRAMRPEVDHIFPQSKLRALGYAETQVNDYANFRLISKRDNIWKSNQDPQPYFDANPGAAHRYLVPLDLLTYDKYPDFLNRRRALIWAQVNRFFGLDGGKEEQPAEPVIGQPVLKPGEAPVEKAAPETAASRSAADEAAAQNVLRQIFDGLLTDDQRALSVLQDTTKWYDIYIEKGFSSRWSSRYSKALWKAGVRNIGDLAAAVMALKLKVAYYSYDLPFYQFASLLPDGRELSIPTRDFGGYAWKWALKTLERRGLDWTEHLLA